MTDPFGSPAYTYEALPLDAGPALNTLLSELRKTRAGVLHAKLRAVGVDDASGWFRGGTILQQDANFRALLDSDALRAALPELALPDTYPLASPPRFAPGGSTLLLDGELALALVHGGAYVCYAGTAAQAKALALAAVAELVQDRHEDFDVYSSEEPWTAWFYDVAWDQTWFLVDRGRLEVTVLCMTDTD